MTIKLSRGNLSRGRAVRSALHRIDPGHLHTGASELARFASKDAVDAATVTRVGATTSGTDVETPLSASEHTNPGLRAANLAARRLRRRHSRARASAWTRVGIGVTAVMLAGGAGFVARTTSPSPAPPNSVVAIGGARVLAPSTGLDLHVGLIGIASDPKRPGYWLAAADGGVFAFGHAGYFGSLGGGPLNAPIVGIAAAPSGRGYWLVGADGGVFAFGHAGYFGSMAGISLTEPITAIVPTPSGKGYWLTGADGGVFAFGDATFLGSAEGMNLAGPIVGAAATSSGKGYWLLGSDGGVFSFGDARFAGAQPDPSHPAVGIAASTNGRGYWIAHADGSVTGFHARPTNGARFSSAAGDAQTVGIARSSTGGYWLAQGAADESSTLSSDPFLACTRAHESNSAGGYHAVSAGGTYRGAYQFDQSTWNSAARLAGRSDLVGADPATASPADQDLLAFDLFQARGPQPWGGRCAGLT